MNKRQLINGVVGAAVITGLAVIGAITCHRGLAQTDEIKAVMDVLNADAAAVEKGNLSALDKLWANTEDVTVFESGHANYGWADYRNHHLAPELKEFKNATYTFSDLKVKVDGKTSWATFKYALSTETGTRKIESAGLATAVLEKRDGKWRIVHWHSSAPRRAPAPIPTPIPK